ncbi:D-aminoacyl-tRNA deacylase [Pseudoglutamicibacter cumminsii]|uniref:D-aminoacyl-tRNA deacylase n=1 Tax=Pseudoglutamicibacter cumminsii TaxID=156979 RepID=UPI0021A3369F|nr:D-aminoacyl-tRNA deacylase [Pseudoglutamicibacter cumminsii]MCT1685518.1 D-aminoacyl-tRNA deacylase [Pseudoglutamicibacter cumminsii]
MRAVVQRVKNASVKVDGEVVSGFEGQGLLVLLGVAVDDGHAEAAAVASKIAHLRILDDEKSVVSAQAPVIVVSNFTLYGDVRKGRRPSWSRAARPEAAVDLYEEVAATLRGFGLDVGTGVFGAEMDVQLTNDGPVTLIIDSAELAL